MLKIGEFSRLSGVSAKSLRHYDRLELFRPIWVDRSTAYRFYSPAQLPELYRIIALRDLGLPLGDVADLVAGGADLHAELTRRRSELRAERDQLDRRLAALDLLVGVDGRSEYPDVVVRNTQAELVAGLRVLIAPTDDLEPLFDELETFVRDSGARAERPPATLVHADSPTQRRLDIEIIVPLQWKIDPTARISCRHLESTRAACLIHRGPYDGLPAARRTLARWATASDHPPTGPLRIVYLQFGADPTLRTPTQFLTDSAQHLVTELQQPI